MPPKSTTRLSPQAFAATQLHLLDREAKTEIAENTLLLSSSAPQTLARAGLALLNLSVISQKTGLGGRTVLELGLDSAVKSGSDDLPEHGIRTGDIARVSEQPKGSAKKRDVEASKTKGVEVVVTRVGQRAVWVAAGKEGGHEKDEDDGVDALGDRLWLVKLANDVTYKRMNKVMGKLSKMAESEYTGLMRVLFGLSSPGVPDMLKVKDITFVNDMLNESQKDAIRFSLTSPDIALIHGPPGTGKTHTLIELILQMLKHDLRILVCGPSNISVDNIVERLAPYKVPLVRLGHPARLLPSVLNHSLEVLTRTSDAAGIVHDVRKEMDEKQASVRKSRSGRERRTIYGEMKELRKEFREREAKCVENLIVGSKVVLATLHGSGGFQMKRQEFDVVIIDEASQALEAQCWVPLLSAKKVVLAGDPFQLPPTVKSSNENQDKDGKKQEKQHLQDELEKLSISDEEKKVAQASNLETTMFDRLLAMHGPDIKRLLNTQYRMNEKIMTFPAAELYESKLVAADSVKDRLLKDLPYKVEAIEDTMEPLIFFDTQGGDFPENIEERSSEKRSVILGDSKSNTMEAALVGKHAKDLVHAGVKPEDIAIITPYNAQVAVLSQLLKEKYPGMEFGSVDGFQGREKEAVIVSLVRSNPELEVGFLGEKRRMNVAMTRPKRHLAIIGDSETVSRGSTFLKRWMKFLEEHADLRYPDLADLQLD